MTKSEEYLVKCISKHGTEKYDYNNTKYVKSSIDVEIYCMKHKTKFMQAPKSHLLGYHGCPECKKEHKQSSAYSKLRDTTDSFIEKAKAIHGDLYDYSRVQYSGSSVPVSIRCIKHNEVFFQKPTVHLRGFCKCQKCFLEKMQNAIQYDTDSFVSKSVSVHGDKYDYSKSNYTSCREPVTITCGIHGDFEQIAYYHLAGNGCQRCGIEDSIKTSVSSSEKEILEFVRSIDDEAYGSDRRLIFPLELDVISHKHKLAIEFDGLYWHSSGSIEDDLAISKKHLEKTINVESHGYTLFHVFENEWVHSREIVKSMIASRMGASKRIPARKCGIVELTATDAAEFFSENHLQGTARGASIFYGLEFNGTIVSVVSFGKSRYTVADWELFRMANLLNTTVVGGFSKLLSHFKKMHTGSIVSYANRRWSTGNVYIKNGFEFSHNSKPCYWYVDPRVKYKIHHRSAFMKHTLEKSLPVFDSGMSERENMYKNKYRRLWDCGNMVFILNN